MERTPSRSEEHTSELQSRPQLVCRLLLEKKKNSVTPVRADNAKSASTWSRSKDPGDLIRADCCCKVSSRLAVFFFFNDTATTEIYTLSLHDALPIPTPS